MNNPNMNQGNPGMTFGAGVLSPQQQMYNNPNGPQ